MLALINEESRFPKGTDYTLLEKLHSRHAVSPHLTLKNWLTHPFPPRQTLAKSLKCSLCPTPLGEMPPPPTGSDALKELKLSLISLSLLLPLVQQ